MPFKVFTQSYRELRRPVRYWTLALLGTAALILVLYPLLGLFLDLDWLGAQGSAGFIFGYEPGQIRLSRLEDWFNATGVHLLFPLLMAVYAAQVGSWLGAGEEERGSLGLLLAAPLARWRFMLEKSSTLVVVLALPVGVFGLALLLVRLAGLNIGFTLSYLVGLYLLALLYGALALALGCFFGRRRISLWISLAALALAFLVSRLSLIGSLRLVSPFYLYSISPANPSLLWLLLLFVCLCLGAGWVGFESRDLAV